MKAEEILKKEDIPEEECGVCALHEAANEKLPEALFCTNPECGKPLEDFLVTRLDLTVVGETNGYDGDEEIRKIPVIECPHCYSRTGLLPIPVTYNANHDIYYTGGKDYVPHEEFKLPESIVKKIENYHRRLKAGEKLQPWNLKTWIEYELEHIVAEKLYKHGLKV